MNKKLITIIGICVGVLVVVGVVLALVFGGNTCVFKKGDIVILAYDNSREAQAFYCEFSKNITLENITIYRSGGYP